MRRCTARLSCHFPPLSRGKVKKRSLGIFSIVAAVTHTTLPLSLCPRGRGEWWVVREEKKCAHLRSTTVVRCRSSTTVFTRRRKGKEEEEEEGEGEVRFSFAFVRGEVWRGFERGSWGAGMEEAMEEGGGGCLTASDGGNKGMEKREDDMGEGWVRRRWRHHRGPMCLSRFYKSIKRGISD